MNDKGFGIIRSKGDQALFRLTAQQLKRKLGIPATRPIADFLPTISIKAKDFAAEMTTFKNSLLSANGGGFVLDVQD